MAFQLPQDQATRELFDLSLLAKVGQGEATISLFEARNSARRMLLDEFGDVINPEICGVTYIVTMANGDVKLVHFTRDKAPAYLWDFGKI